MTAQSAIAYWNGAYLPLDQVSVSPLDRGFLFADGVYEVVAVYNGRLFRAAEHLQRLANSLAGIELEARDHDWPALLACIVERNGGGDLSVYLQVTRGAPAVRDHGFPSELTPPTVFAMAKPLKPLSDAVLRAGLTAITMPDIRWGACHLKTIALLPNVLARQRALAQGAADAILVRDGYITETSAGNVFLVRDGTLYTPRKDHRILPGITRDVILELAA
ncbi:MAG: aminotransferase class IV, partial [Gammaproteobacteria bacterium]